MNKSTLIYKNSTSPCWSHSSRATWCSECQQSCPHLSANNRASFCISGEHQRCPSGKFLYKERASARFFRQFFLYEERASARPSGKFLCKERALATLLPGVPALPALQPSQTLKIPKNIPTPTLPTVSDNPASKPSVNKC